MAMTTQPKLVGQAAPDWTLPATDGKTCQLSEVAGPNGTVIAFICNHCPYVQAIVEPLRTAADTLQAEGIPVFGIMSNNYDFVAADSPENMQSFAAENGLTFPYLVDEDQSVAKAYDAICTPDIFGFAADRSMQYRGNVETLVTAMQSIRETGVGPSHYAASSGSSIKWR